MSNRKRAKIGQPKIHGFMARSAYSLVLLYRRRRSETFVVQFNYADKMGRPRNKFSVGSRFTGRFYPTRCDLSPDGKHFVYFVMGGHQAKFAEQYCCWTAMCRPPQLNASLLLPHDDTWGGGGMFLNDQTLIIEGGMHDSKKKLEQLHMSNVEGVNVFVNSGYVSLTPPAKLPKPVDGGWRPANVIKRLWSGQVWRKSAKRASLVLREREAKRSPGDFDHFEYALIGNTSQRTILDGPLAEASWADFDRLGRLILGIGHELHIYTSPRQGMSEKPNRVIDLEKATEPD